MIRDLNLHDLSILEKEAKFPLPNLVEPLYCIKKSIMDNDELIGSFWVHLTSETSLVLRSDISRIAKARAIREIFLFLRSELVKLGLTDNHVFIKDKDLDTEVYYSKILKRHFQFEDIIGIPLVIRRQDG